jgi:D-alanyl-lipoteichoic acid acyltransferase DltB (MBOAT superfamily)
MLFNSPVFLVFFALFFPVFLALRKNVLARNVLLLVASYIFYGWWDPRFLVLVAVSTSVDYMAALGAAGKAVGISERLKSAGFLVAVTIVSIAFARTPSLWIMAYVLVGTAAVLLATFLFDNVKIASRQTCWLMLSLVTNLGILAYFKYANFFISSLTDAANAAGLGIDLHMTKIILPVGLSFYTFQAISRTIDSYLARFNPGNSLINYAAYHAFFPQLVAGPIERAAHLMPQFERVLPISLCQMRDGALLFMWGLYQKLVVADNIAPLVNTVFNDPAGKSGGETIAAVLAFTIQIYCDFCGYSNMARGLARILGFDLMINFNQPYFSRSLSEFWQRWHISLSSWMRDYLFIPLGGNRHGTFALYRNLLLTMLIGGLWHGANWTFVAWGAFHGLGQIVFRMFQVEKALAWAKQNGRRGAPVHLFFWCLTMIVVMAGWIFFRAQTFAIASQVFANIANLDGYTQSVFWPLLIYAGPLVLLEIYQRLNRGVEILTHGPVFVRLNLIFFVAFSILVLHSETVRDFIYFDF